MAKSISVYFYETLNGKEFHFTVIMPVVPVVKLSSWSMILFQK